MRRPPPWDSCNAVTRLFSPVLMVRLSAMPVPEKIPMRVESSPMSAKAKCSHGEASHPEANRFCAQMFPEVMPAGETPAAASVCLTVLTASLLAIMAVTGRRGTPLSNTSAPTR